MSIDLPSVRRASADDVPALSPLFNAYRQFYERPPDLEGAAAWLRERLGRRESVVLLSPASDAPVGFCQLYPTFCSVEMAPVWVLYDLYVAPSARRSGVARALLGAAERHARETRATRLELSTARTNRAAQALYESLGWVRDDVFFVYAKRV